MVKSGAQVAENSDGIQQSDVTRWGIAAIAFATIAVLGSTLSAVLPQSIWVGLHANRLEGGNLNQLRAEVTRLRDQQLVMRRQATQLRSRLIIAERGRSEVGQRVNALESSIPLLLEVVPPGAEIDRGLFTAAIGDAGDTSVTFEAEGGSVTLVRRPLFEEGPGAPNVAQALPPALSSPSGPDNSPDPDQSFISAETNADLEADLEAGSQLVASLPPALENGPVSASELTSLGIVEASAELTVPGEGEPKLTQTQFGIAIGGAVSLGEADALWQDLSNKLGTLLLGLEPAISDPLNNASFRIVAGPVPDYAQAELLCLRIARVGIECLPVQFQQTKAISLR